MSIKVEMATGVDSRVSPATLGVGVGRALALESSSPKTQAWLRHFPALWPQESFIPPELQFAPFVKSQYLLTGWLSGLKEPSLC